MATPGPESERPSAESADGGFVARLKRLFRVGPFEWVFKSLPMNRRFRAGSHMHGLDNRDIAEPDVPRGPGETNLREEQAKRSDDLPPR